MTTFESRIPARMRERREELHVSQEDVGRSLGVTLRTYARWERGESLGYLSRIADLARALKITERELVGSELDGISQPTVTQLYSKLDEVLVELGRIREQLPVQPTQQKKNAG